MIAQGQPAPGKAWTRPQTRWLSILLTVWRPMVLLPLLWGPWLLHGFREGDYLLTNQQSSFSWSFPRLPLTLPLMNGTARVYRRLACQHWKGPWQSFSPILSFYRRGSMLLEIRHATESALALFTAQWWRPTITERNVQTLPQQKAKSWSMDLKHLQSGNTPKSRGAQPWPIISPLPLQRKWNQEEFLVEGRGACIFTVIIKHWVPTSESALLIGVRKAKGRTKWGEGPKTNRVMTLFSEAKAPLPLFVAGLQSGEHFNLED